VNNAFKKGFTVEVDCDASENSFSSKHGLAIIPENGMNQEEAFKSSLPEKEITQELRQQEFENFNTTDDHLMHIIRVLKDENDKRYFKVKNSWGNNSVLISNNGFIYISEAYFKLKTISVMIHKDVLN
jgi:bleomycin hydrolase